MSKLILFFSLFLALSTFAAPWITNKDHSEIHFQVPYMGVSEITGRFNEFTGKIDMKDNGDVGSSLDVSINSASVDTGNKMRDGHLRGSDFFQSAQHPQIQFVSKNIKEVKKNLYRAMGEMSIKGIKKPATIDFTITDSLKDTWGFENKFVKFTTLINRKDYKINWNKSLDGKQFLVGDEVIVKGTFQIQPATGLTPNSKHMIPDSEIIRERDLERQTQKGKEEESTLSKKLRKLINGQ